MWKHYKRCSSDLLIPGDRNIDIGIKSHIIFFIVILALNYTYWFTTHAVGYELMRGELPRCLYLYGLNL